MFDDIRDFFDDHRGISIAFLISIGLIIISSFLFSPFFTLEITFIIFMVLSVLIIALAIIIDFIISTRIGIKLTLHIYQDWLLILIKVIGILGSIFGVYYMVREILNIEWINWGIKSFYFSMEPSSNPFSNAEKSILDEDVLPKYIYIWKALFINIGQVIFFFIKNILAPWSWISITIGVFKAF